MSPIPKPRRNTPLTSAVFPFEQRKAVPYQFVLDTIAPLSPYTRPMFGCLAIYVKDKIVLILRHKPESKADNGVWLATTEEHHKSLRHEFPNMRSIRVLGKPVTGWQVLPADVPDFEEAALRACELVLAGDPRIGKVPGSRRPAKKMANSSGPKARSVARVPDQELRSWQFTSTVMSMAAFLRGLRGFAKVSTTARVIFEKDTSGSRQLDAHDENETR